MPHKFSHHFTDNDRITLVGRVRRIDQTDQGGSTPTSPRRCPDFRCGGQTVLGGARLAAEDSIDRAGCWATKW
jgi:hypothetical protein